jgi:hypothetical protein
MCYQGAAASGAQGASALRHGIMILMVPTLAVFVGIFGLIYHRRNVARLSGTDVAADAVTAPRSRR